MKLRKYTECHLREAIKNSASLARTLSKLGVAAYGGNYYVLKRAIHYFNLDISHFTGQLLNKGRNTGPKQPLRKYLSSELQIRSCKLKERLLSEGIFTAVCTSCKGTEWLGQPIPLELDHINGDQ